MDDHLNKNINMTIDYESKRKKDLNVELREKRE